MLTRVCSVEKSSPKFYDLKIYRKTLVQCVQESARTESARDPESIPTRRVSLLRFCDHGLVGIVRDLTVKKYCWCRSYVSDNIFIIILAAVSEGHKLDILLVPLLVHVHRFLIYLGAFTRKYWILRFNFLVCEKKFFSLL